VTNGTGENGGFPSALSDTWVDKPWRAVRLQVLEDLERAYLARLLERTGGHVGKTARHAGMQPRSLFEKMKRYGLRKEDFRRNDG
jgi:DNA-binding NtrC family response regulator